MSRKASVATIILVLITFIALSLGAGVFYLFQKEQARSSMLQSELDSAVIKYKKTESELQGASSKIVTLDLKIKEIQSRMDVISGELQQEKMARQEALSNMELLKADLTLQKSSRLDLEAKLNQTKEELKKTRDQLKDLASQKVELDSKVKDLEARTKDVELGKIVVNQEAVVAPEAKEQPAKQSEPLAKKEKAIKTAAISSKEGKVLVINKDYDFVVISLGTKDGIKIGDIFSISHNNKNIGEVKIEKVSDNMAAAGFAAKDIKEKISEGDKVVQKAR